MGVKDQFDEKMQAVSDAFENVEPHNVLMAVRDLAAWAERTFGEFE